MDRKRQQVSEKIFTQSGKIGALREMIDGRGNLNVDLEEKEKRDQALRRQQRKKQPLLEITPDKKLARKPFPLSFNYYESEQILVFCLIDSELKFYNLRKSRKYTVALTESPLHYHSEFMPIRILIGQHKVSKAPTLFLLGEHAISIHTIESQVSLPLVKYNFKSPITWAVHDPEFGLIAVTFDGRIKILDPIDFKIVWDFQLDGTTITLCDYSRSLSYIAVSGVEGIVNLLDGSARFKISHYQAQKSEILGLRFFEEHKQVMVVHRNRVVVLYDAN